MGKYFFAICTSLFLPSISLAQITLQMPFDRGQWWGPASYTDHPGWQPGREKCIDWWFILNQTDNQPGPEARPQWNQGISAGKTIRSSHNGTVIRKITGSTEYGNHVVIRSEENGDYLTLYAHMENNNACPAVGQRVNAGDPIGIVGSTGNTGSPPAPHMHFEFLKETVSGARTNGSWQSQNLPGISIDGQTVDFLAWNCIENFSGGGFRYQGRPMKSRQNFILGSDIYVSITGNDTSGNGSSINPFRSVSKAIQMANSDANVRTTIHIKGGNYPGALSTRIDSTHSKNIIFVNDGGGSANIGRN